jgi:hypothetical protein
MESLTLMGVRERYIHPVTDFSNETAGLTVNNSGTHLNSS